MKHPRTKRAEAAVFRGLVRAVQALPEFAARSAGSLMGELMYLVDPRHPRVARRNLQTAFPSLPRRTHQQIAHTSFRRQGSLLFDSLRLVNLEAHEICGRLDVEGWEHYERAERAGRGVLIFSAHYGVYDVILHAVPIYKGPLHIVVRATGNEVVDNLVMDLRRRSENQFIQKRGAVWGMLEALRAGGRVAILLDQRVHPNEGIEVPFFGHLSWTSPFPARVSQRTGAPALPMFAYQAPKGRFRLVIREPIFPDGLGDDETLRLSCRYLAAIEAEVRRHPEEWLWMHERWRRH